MLLRSPRFRFRSALFAAAFFLLLVGTVAHRRAFQLQREELEARIRALEARPVAAPVVSPSGDDQRAEGETTGAESASLPSTPPMRFEGAGRSGVWRYADVRLSDGSRRRYYIRDDASPEQVTAWLGRIQADQSEAVFNASSLYRSRLSVD